jgi:hypothetical protein
MLAFLRALIKRIRGHELHIYIAKVGSAEFQCALVWLGHSINIVGPVAGLVESTPAAVELLVVCLELHRERNAEAKIAVGLQILGYLQSRATDFGRHEL